MKLWRWLLGVVALPGMAVVLAGTEGQALAAGARSLRVQHGVLTVDGLTAATGVEMKIANLHYLYVALPGAGTVVISEKPFAGAREQKAAFQGSTLTVTAEGRRVQLTARNRMRGTRAAFVCLERGVGASVRVPAVSYGDSSMGPEVWPEGTRGRELASRVVRVKGGRAPRTAKLCRPSAHGRELCATVREVMYKP